MTHAIVGALILAALSTFGDFVWANWQVRHLALYGVLHGMGIFLAIGLCLGVSGGRPLLGAILGVTAGAAAAASFYLMRPVLGYSAMFVSWILVWMILADVNILVHLPRHASVMASALVRAPLTRGLAAALLSGAAFYAVSGMWFPFNPRGWDYAVHFGSWTIAYLPGFVVLLAGGPERFRR